MGRGSRCVAPSCCSKDKKLYAFPREQERCHCWILNCGRDPSWKPSVGSRLCELHFEATEFELHRADGKKKLKWNAVPTIFKARNQNSPMKRPNNSLIPVEVPSIPAPADTHRYCKRQRVDFIEQCTTDQRVPDDDESEMEPWVEDDKVIQQNFMKSIEIGNEYVEEEQVIEQNLIPIIEASNQCLEHEEVGQTTSNNKRSHKVIQQNFMESIEIGNEYVEEEQVIEQNLIPIIETSNQCLEQEEVGQTTSYNKRSQHLEDEVIRLKRKLKNTLRQLRVEKLKSETFRKNLAQFLNEDQIRRLMMNNKSRRGMKWSNKTVKRSLQIRCATGVKGYSQLIKQGYPLPSYRTLCERVQNSQFKEGIHNDVIEWLKVKMESQNNFNRDCVLALDEMQLRPTVEYDKGLNRYVGLVTKPFTSDKPATHALVYIVRGLSSAWKQTVAYYFTGDSTQGKVLWEVTRNVIEAVDKIGLFVRVCVSDMGSANQDMWKHVGVCSTRSELINAIDHPCRVGSRLYFSADTPHLLKNIRNCLLTQTISLPESTVVSNNLPSNIVSLQHVKDLVKMQENTELKIAPKLKAIHVSPGQYQKMKVSFAAQVLSHSTASALNLCVSRELLPPDASTTAWFLEAMNTWFDALNARYALASLFLSSSSKIAHLQMIVELFGHLHFGGRDSWKPIQTGVRLTTTTTLCLYEDLVVNGPYKFLLTGRITQDCVENLFSQIRSKGDAHPTPVHFRHSMRLISISQYMHVSANSSYECDSDTYFLDFVKERSKRSSRSLVVIDLDDEEVAARDCSAELPMSTLEGNALYIVAGWCVYKEKAKLSGCSLCLNCITGTPFDAPLQSELTVLKSFTHGGGLTHPSSAVLQAVIAAESLFQSNKDILVHTDDVHSFLMKAFSCQFALTGFPTCHNAVWNIIARYLRLRIHVFGSKLTSDVRAKISVQHGSKSAHCRTKVK